MDFGRVLVNSPGLMLAGLYESGTIKTITVARSPLVVNGPLWGVVLEELKDLCYTREVLEERRDPSFMQGRAVFELLVSFDTCPGGTVAHEHQEGAVLLQQPGNTEASAS